LATIALSAFTVPTVGFPTDGDAKTTYGTFE
jgi:hypothetical protein